jgi:outer membrane murein-binding lipoprotein Lpp
MVYGEDNRMPSASAFVLNISHTGRMQMKLNGGEMRNMTQSTLGETRIDPQSSTWFSSLKVLGAMLVCGSLLSGCVSTEKYEAEKARALNFQRLLAQEEKRTGELNVKYQDAQRQLGSLESQGRDLNTELEAIRDQLNRSHDELSRVRDQGMEVKDDLKLSEPSLAEFGLDDLDFKDSDLASFESDFGENNLDTSLDSFSLESDNTIALGLGGGSSHTVEKGETLYRLSRQYGVSVDDLKAWNSLPDNTIHVGQEIIVSYP